MGAVALVAWAVLGMVRGVWRVAVAVGTVAGALVVGWAETTRLDDVGAALGVAFGCDGVRYVSLFAAASSADLRIARLV